jgi:hypothetical protein
MLTRRNLLASALLRDAALAKPSGGEERRKLLRVGDLPPDHPCGIGCSGTGDAFSDHFASYNPNLWHYNSFEEGGGALWTNDPTLTPLIYDYGGGHLNFSLRRTPAGHGITKPYISGIQDTYNPPNHFAQRYGYFEVVVAVDRCIGLLYECLALSPFNWPPNFSICSIWTDANNIMKVYQFASGEDAILVSTDQRHGWDPSKPHAYGVNWTSRKIEFYKDRQRVGSWANPGRQYTNGDPLYVKMHCNTKFYPALLTIASPHSLPKAAHVYSLNVWTAKPF